MDSKQREDLLVQYNQYLQACYATFDALLKQDGMEWTEVNVSTSMASGKVLMDVVQQEAMDSLQPPDVVVDLCTRFALLGFNILDAMAKRDQRIVIEARGDHGKSQDTTAERAENSIVEAPAQVIEVGPQAVPTSTGENSGRGEGSIAAEGEESTGLGEVPGVSNSGDEEKEKPVNE